MRIDVGMRRGVALIATGALAFAGMAAGVSPDSSSGAMAPGESMDVIKSVTVDEAPPKLDFHLLVDLSGSYGDDLANIKDKSSDIAAGILGEVADVTFGASAFIDFPCSPYGGTSDYGYALSQTQTTNVAAWSAAIDAMSVGWGSDFPESQYEGLYQAVTGVGNDGGSCPAGAIAPGQQAGFRPDATKVIAITTDAGFHDSDTEGGYPGAGRNATIAALQAAGVRVIALKAGAGANPQMDELATETGGVTVTTSTSSDDIVEAILAGVAAINVDVTMAPVACDGLDVTFSPASYEDVPSGATYEFTETIAVSTDLASLPADGIVTCSVDFYVDGAVVGTQTISVEVLPVEVSGGGRIDDDGRKLTFSVGAHLGDDGSYSGKFHVQDHPAGGSFKSSSLTSLGGSGQDAVLRGAGEWNHTPGYTYEVHIHDDGQGKKSSDHLSYTVWDSGGAVVSAGDAPLNKGNVKVNIG